jgi:HSP20 family molecular chaperone IbpA
MNRLFDDVFRGFDLASFGATDRSFDRAPGWPHIEVSETETDIKVSAELPGLEEKDLDIQLANSVLAITGEKKSETEDKDRRFSERYYGRFERRIPVEDIDEGKVTASFKNGVLQAGEVTGILVENSIYPASGYSDVAVRIEHSEGVAVLQRAPRAHRETCCRDIEGLLLRSLDGRRLRLRNAQLILGPFWRPESGPDRGSACS